MYEVVEHYAKKHSKTVDEFFEEAVINTLKEARENPEQPMKYLHELHEKAKKVGLTTVEYIDKAFEEEHKRLGL